MPDETPVDPNAPPVEPQAVFDPTQIVNGLTNLVTELEAEVGNLKRLLEAALAEKTAIEEQFKALFATLGPKVQAAIDLVRSHLPGR